MAVILVSRVPQWIDLDTRVAAWRRAIDTFLREKPAGRILEIVLPGELRSSS
jgi:hypothetical protein